MAALLDRIKGSAGFRVIAIVGAIGFLLGALLLAYGLWRARAVQPWMAGVIAAGRDRVLHRPGDRQPHHLRDPVPLYLVAFVPLDWRVLTQSDEEWAGKPRHAAATPVPGSTA